MGRRGRFSRCIGGVGRELWQAGFLVSFLLTFDFGALAFLFLFFSLLFGTC